MSAQSGFLNCFLKFIQGEQGEKLPSMGRAKPLSARFTITMDERKAILTASSKRLNQEQKASEPSAEKPKKRRGRQGQSDSKRVSRSTRSRRSVSEVESESGDNDGSESQVGNDERLSGKDDLNDKDSGNSEESKSEKLKGGDEEGPSDGIKPLSDDSSGENGKVLRDKQKSSGKSNQSTKKKASSCNDANEEATASENSVILNGEADKSQGDEADSGASGEAREKKKKGRKRKNDSREDGMPRRKLSSRRAKQKSRISYAESGDEEDIPGLDDNSDSDDPVWVPDEKRGSSDEGSNFSWSKYEKLHSKTKKSSTNSPVVSPSKLREKVKGALEEKGAKQTPAENSANVNSDGVGNSGSIKVATTGEKSELVTKSTATKETAESNGVAKAKESAKTPVAASIVPPVKQQPVEKSDIFSPSVIVMPFQSGTFIAQKAELEEKEEPPIWRVDGKSLLQKYEPFRSQNGNLWYRNVSTYSGWGPKSNLKYQEVPVKFIKQNRLETIVEIIQAELKISDERLCEKLMKEYEKHAYAYEVFVQTLVSQALDSNFLPEIIAEKDEYFLNCVEEMDKMCEEKKNKMMEACQWPKKLTESLTTWPTMTESQCEPRPSINCNVCYANKGVTNVKMDGNPYKFSTLEYEPPSEDSFKSKEFTVCTSCSETLMLFHKIVHLKYHTYENGTKMVSEKKTEDPEKNNTDILHDILADGPRIKKEFQEISKMWAQADVKARCEKAEDKRVNIILK